METPRKFINYKHQVNLFLCCFFACLNEQSGQVFASYLAIKQQSAVGTGYRILLIDSFAARISTRILTTPSFVMLRLVTPMVHVGWSTGTRSIIHYFFPISFSMLFQPFLSIG